MQFAVPQFIEVEDKVIGPLTVKQFIFLVVGGVLLVIFYSLADIPLFILLAVIDLAVVVSFAFIKINGRPFQVFITSFYKFNTKPKLMTWFREPELNKIKTKLKKHVQLQDVIEPVMPDGKRLIKSQLNELANTLDRDMTIDMINSQIQANQTEV